ncbi:MAG TPA: ubiquinol oxidase subunit II [Sphingomicrobium sp.]|jgi:cytochrome o ubiquinol oxidase subunit 2
MNSHRSTSSPRRRLTLAALPFLLLGGCNAVVMNPAGDVAVQQRDLILIATGLMLLVIVPVIALTGIFAWRYRQSNTDAAYEPEWDHSTQLELVIWAIPLLIIIVLGAVTWVSTHVLDPYRPIERLGPNRLIAKDARPLQVQVVALDWKWLFIYPEYGIATVNQLAAPVDRPIEFKITSSTVMNAFYIPALAGMIYAMPGMETKLHAVINKPGDYEGFSSNYSGAGYSGMRFRFYGMSDQGFDRWVAGVKAKPVALGRANYLMLEKPTENVRPMHFGTVDPTLYKSALNMCVRPGSTCMDQMMMIDARGGGGKHAAEPRNGMGHADGALEKKPGEKGAPGHWSKPMQAPAPGAKQPGSQQNRDLTLNSMPPAAAPGLRQPARA